MYYIRYPASPPISVLRKSISRFSPESRHTAEFYYYYLRIHPSHLIHPYSPSFLPNIIVYLVLQPSCALIPSSSCSHLSCRFSLVKTSNTLAILPIMGLHPSNIRNKATLPLNRNTRVFCDINHVIRISRLIPVQSSRLFRLPSTLAPTWLWLRSASTP